MPWRGGHRVRRGRRGLIGALHFLTDFADEAVVAPLAVAVAAILAVGGWRRGALAWSLAVAGSLGTMTALKLACFACGWRIPWAGLASPSGHTAAAAMVYGGLLVLLLSGRDRPQLGLAVAAGGALALTFGLTRLALGVHTVADVLVGAAVGMAGAVLLAVTAGPRPRRLSGTTLAICAALIMAGLHGRHVNAEGDLHRIAVDLWPLSACGGKEGQGALPPGPPLRGEPLRTLL